VKTLCIIGSGVPLLFMFFAGFEAHMSAYGSAAFTASAAVYLFILAKK
jgi:hypothetical protein